MRFAALENLVCLVGGLNAWLNGRDLSLIFRLLILRVIVSVSLCFTFVFRFLFFVFPFGISGFAPELFRHGLRRMIVPSVASLGPCDTSGAGGVCNVPTGEAKRGRKGRHHPYLDHDCEAAAP